MTTGILAFLFVILAAAAIWFADWLVRRVKRKSR